MPRISVKEITPVEELSECGAAKLARSKPRDDDLPEEERIGIATNLIGEFRSQLEWQYDHLVQLQNGKIDQDAYAARVGDLPEDLDATLEETTEAMQRLASYAAAIKEGDAGVIKALSEWDRLDEYEKAELERRAEEVKAILRQRLDEGEFPLAVAYREKVAESRTASSTPITPYLTEQEIAHEEVEVFIWTVSTYQSVVDMGRAGGGVPHEIDPDKMAIIIIGGYLETALWAKAQRKDDWDLELGNSSFAAVRERVTEFTSRMVPVLEAQVAWDKQHGYKEWVETSDTE